MNASLIDVAIVLIGIYIALSVAASWVQEQIAALTHLRGKNLFNGVYSLLANHAQLTRAIFDHPMVTASVDKGVDTFPSYLEARNFSLALWQSVHDLPGPAKPLSSFTALPHQVLASLDGQVAALPPVADGLKKSLSALINTAGGDYDKLLTATDAWFDSQMDRVSGWYKRTAQWWLVAFGAIIVLVSGVDSISVAKQAYASPAFTAAFASGVAESLKKSAASAPAPATPAPGTSPVPATAPSGTLTAEQRDAAEKQVAAVVNDALAKEPAFKIFWSRATLPENGNISGWFTKILGLLLTIVAVSLGAPFWFDLLKCIINVRMAGQKPDSSAAKKP